MSRDEVTSRRCRRCHRLLQRGESLTAHIEVCGALDDEEAEHITETDYDDIIDEETEDE